MVPERTGGIRKTTKISVRKAIFSAEIQNWRPLNMPYIINIDFKFRNLHNVRNTHSTYRVRITSRVFIAQHSLTRRWGVTLAVSMF
jgi:hypothetical protein